ncbi:phosphonate C-P lyase system protein PhnH [Halorientalis sp.]|uniref:phosphonate C-P lyase system protein PhnH n=1 Tax=Halorientalis sp. TaxID=1931229 RepID=UPI00263A17C7|nr:phosphonate C-P lyase system protein PhnH [Halorientalis sp.]
MRAVGIDPVGGTRTTFRALLDVMSRPGTVESVPERADQAVVSTLVDHEVSVATDDDELRDALSGQGRLDAAAHDTADIVHVRDHTEFDVTDCQRGSLVEPSDGATVVYAVEDLVPTTDADLSTVTLSGPGVDGHTELSVALPESELAAVAAAQSDYPRGVDAIFTTEDRVAAVPRSASMEVA